jgi:hypothetical protein
MALQLPKGIEGNMVCDWQDFRHVLFGKCGSVYMNLLAEVIGSQLGFVRAAGANTGEVI